MELPLEKKRKGLFAPMFGKKVIYYIDDLGLGRQELHKNKPSVHELMR
jgi:hypothetical protein